ncbi:MAG: metal ABC transporter ATP-binding protein [Prevotella sp.]|nr:metal ABC transporter ATP-binding protein [Prevotella sp.]
MQPIISIRNMTAGYDGKPTITDVNMHICEQEFVGIVGPNGGGKTTLLKAMLKLIKPMKGSVDYDRQLNIGYLPQYNAADKQFPISVRDTVMSGLNGELGVFGRVNDRHIERLNNTLQRFMLTDLAQRPLRALSGGQLQRVLIARAMISNPDVLVLDEPHTYVDKDFGEEIDKMLVDESRRRTIVMVSHNLEYVKEFASKMVLVDKTVTLLS